MQGIYPVELFCGFVGDRLDGVLCGEDGGRVDRGIEGRRREVHCRVGVCVTVHRRSRIRCTIRQGRIVRGSYHGHDVKQPHLLRFKEVDKGIKLLCRYAFGFVDDDDDGQ